jgi:hypothetical protein
MGNLCLLDALKLLDGLRSSGPNAALRECASRSFNYLGFLVSVAARHEDVVQGLLLTTSLLLLIDVTLLVRHICQRFAISVRLVVNLDLLVALLLKNKKILEERSTFLSRSLDLPYQHLQMAGRNRLLHCVLSRLMRLCNLRVQLFYLVQYTSHFELNLLERTFLALL